MDSSQNNQYEKERGASRKEVHCKVGRAATSLTYALITQLVEYQTFNLGVEVSSTSERTKRGGME